MEISLVSDVKRLKKNLTRQQRDQLPFAISAALNNVAFDARESLQKALPHHLDRPTSYTKRGVQVKKSDKRNLTAFVGFAGGGFGRLPGGASVAPSEYMGRLMRGGTRHPRRRAIPVPTHAFKTNKFGNIGRGKIAKLIADPKYFSGVPRGRGQDAAGIWKRGKPKKGKPGNLRMVIAWEPQTHYRGGRFPMRQIVDKVVRLRFPDRFASAMQQALRTAR